MSWQSSQKVKLVDEIQSRIAAVMQESMTGVPLTEPELAAFTKGLAANYLALMRERNFARFGQVQQVQMSQAIRAGVNVARILAAIDSAGALTRTLLPH